MDPPGIFIKNRGFPPRDSRHCRGSACSSSNKAVALAFGRRGSARPGCYMIESESKILPLISKALAFLAEGESEAPEKATTMAKRRSLEEMKLEENTKK